NAAEECRADACVAVRRFELWPRAQGQAGVLGAIPSRGLAGPARQPLSVHALRRDDAAGQPQDPLPSKSSGSPLTPPHAFPPPFPRKPFFFRSFPRKRESRNLGPGSPLPRGRADEICLTQVLKLQANRVWPGSL